MKKIIQVLLYHRVCTDREPAESRFVVSRSTFRRQIGFLANHGFFTPRFSDLLDGALTKNREGKHPIIITFDDGYLDNYENAFPILQEFGFSAVIFVVPDFSRRTNWWDPPGRLGNIELLLPQHIKHMSDSGIEFGAHSFSHSSLPSLSDDRLEHELLAARVALEDLVQQPVAMVAYPYGDVDNRVKSAARRLGYQCGFAAHSGPLTLCSDLYEIRRSPVSNRLGWIYLMFKFSILDHLFRWSIWRIKQLVGIKASYHVTPTLDQLNDLGVQR